MSEKKGAIVFDIDGTICIQCDGDYDSLEPYPEAKEIINKLYDEGYYIIFNTSRFMGRCKNDVMKVYREHYSFMKKQLESWGIKFHELHMGKPRADVYVDDKALGHNTDWKIIEQEIRKVVDNKEKKV